MLAIAMVATYDHLHAVLNLARSVRDTWTVQPKVYVALVDQGDRERPGFESLGDLEFVPAHSLGVPDFWWQAAKFTAADLCCVLKPYLLRHVLDRGHGTVVYCDSDMHFFADARDLVEHAPGADLILLPHLTTPFPPGLPDDRPTLAQVANAGLTNGGLFVARRRAGALAFLDTWGTMCTAPGTFLWEYGYQTEQQALNWALTFVENVAVFRDPRFNVAYWNLHERPLRWARLDGGAEDQWTVDGRPLVCFHFSGLAWSEGRLSQHENRHHPSLNVNVWSLCRNYERRLLAAHGAHYAAAGYAYDEVDGRRLPPEVRSELRHLECFEVPRVESWNDVPEALRQAARLIGRTSLLPMYLERMLDKRPDLQGLDPPGSLYRAGFLRWADRWLRAQHPCAPLHEHYTDTAFQVHRLEELAAEVARSPLGLSPEDAAKALVADRPALLDRLSREHRRPELLESIEQGRYRYPAFDPALCLRLIYEARQDLQQAFPDPLGEDLAAFRAWLAEFLPQEFILPPSVRDFVGALDPAGSLARLLSFTQRSDAWRRLVVDRGLGAWAMPQFVHSLTQHPEYHASDIVVAAWWLERHEADARAIVDRTFVPPLATRAATAYLQWWCQQNAVSPSTAPCADGLRDFVERLRAELTVSAEPVTVPRFVRACETARAGLRPGEVRDRLAPSLAPDPRGINVFGHFRSPIGLGTASRGLVEAFDRAGYRTRRLVLTNATMDAGLAPEELHPDFAFNFPRNVVVTYPHIQHDHFALFPPEFFEGRETSAYIAWEQRDLHPAWGDKLGRYDRLFALSRFAADAIAAGTGRRCQPLPCVVSVDATASQRWPRESFGIPRGVFVVGLVFDATSSIERKNPLAVVQAVGRALGGRNALLVIKVSSGGRMRFAPTLRVLVDEARRHRLETRLITDFMPKARLDALIAGCDLYVSLHRSEGFGYTIAEAMMLGVPVVATAYSGNMDFMTDDNAYPVAYREVVVRRQEGPFQLGTVWAEPDLDDAIAQVRRAHERPEEARARAARARVDVEAVVSPAAVARRLRELFDQVPVAGTGPFRGAVEVVAPRVMEPPPLERPIGATDRVFFMHVPKTAGTTLIQLIEGHFDEAEIARWLYPGPVIEAPPDFFVRHRYFHGHVGHGLLRRRLGESPLALTMLREPIDRFLSQWGNHQRVTKAQVPDVPSEQFRRLQQTSLEEFVLDPPALVAPLAANFHDLHAKLLSTAHGDEARLEELLPELAAGRYAYPVPDLDRARQTLASFAFVGLTERFQESLFLLSYTFGWPPVREYRSLNVASVRPRREQLPGHLLDRLAQLNRVDLDLYDHGRRLFEARYERMSAELLERYGRRTHAHLGRSVPPEVIAGLLERHHQRRFVQRQPATNALKLRFDQKMVGTGWHARNSHSAHGTYRWSGPGRRSTVDLPIAAVGDRWLTVSVALHITDVVLASLRVTVNGEGIRLHRRAGEAGATLVEGRIPASALARTPGCVRIVFEVAETVKPTTIVPDSDDERALGIAVNWLEVAAAP
jgi:glycosyltransferase involved in cell wall biosynthesis